jgi:hypothetical protein
MSSERTISSKIDIIRKGVKFGGLEYSDPPAISCSGDAEICLSMRGTVKAHDTMDVTTDLLRPYVIIDGVEHAVGDYLVGTLKTTTKDNVKWWEIECYDQALLCKQSIVESRYYIAAGTLYIDAISALLIDAGITRVMTDDNTDTLTTDREDWDIGESRLTIINALLKEINFYPIYFDLNGVARLAKKTDLTAANITWTYAADKMSILYPECSSELDIFDSPNVFIALLSNAEQSAMKATSENNSPSSALSIIRRQRRIPRVVKVDNIASQAALQEYADNLRNDSLLSTETIEFYTAINPVHSVHDVLVLQHPSIEGIFAETAWSMTLKAGEKMTHKGKRVIYV